MSGAALLLHGSTTRGIDDPYSDLDVWMLVPDPALQAIDAGSETRFFQFELDGKPGHVTVELRDEFDRRLRHCDLPLIAELRLGVVLADGSPDGWGEAIVREACQPMRETVKRAWVRYHYVEMRGEHRAGDNPMERGDPMAVLLATAQTLTHALCAAMTLDGEP
jgi:hypothetical protein